MMDGYSTYLLSDGLLQMTRVEPEARHSMRLSRATSLTSQVESLIEDMCTREEARPGDVLPSEGELAARFGVSRVVVREAMRVVEARGYVTRRQGKRAVISELNAQAVEKYAIRQALRNKRSLLELTEVREALEVHAARLAAIRVRHRAKSLDLQVDAARALLRSMQDAPRSASARAALDMAFHHAIALMSGNKILAQVLDALDRPLIMSREQHHRTALRSGAGSSVWVTEHERVLDAVLSGDPALAVKEMEAHLDLGLAEIRRRRST
jgi:GntR family transcriptional repressor for pyruvate dehydrogenase complex